MQNYLLTTLDGGTRVVTEPLPAVRSAAIGLWIGAGSRESDSPRPVGEYAMSCLGRERVFEHFSRALGIPTALIRLNYACDLRYGVLVDIASSVRDGRPIDLGMGHFNTIWQGDANAILTALTLKVKSPDGAVRQGFLNTLLATARKTGG